MFSDVEGSTHLLQTVGPGVYARTMDAHARLVRAAVERGGGEVVHTEGDSFFVVFGSAVGAVEAAVDAQRSFDRHTWPAGSPLRVRMGLHTGEVHGSGNGLVGVELNRAARIAATAHGGQVVVSDATVAVLAGRVPPGVRVRDLGLHGLKDFSGRTHLHDLVIGGLPSQFPPLRSLGHVLSNLPVSRARMLGRDDALATVDEMLETAALVTLTGPGGVGKTRLALEVASRRIGRPFEAVYFVDFSSVSDASLIVNQIASAIKARTAVVDVQESVITQLRDRRTLLVLDNFEQLVDGSADVGVLLDSVPGLVVLVTSRRPLRLRGEIEHRVEPLGLPVDRTDPATVASSDSVELLIACAAAAGERLFVTEANAAAIAEIVHRLDGLPLAIELAARQLRVVDPAQLATRLEHVDVLTGGARDAPARHRALEETIRWSFSNLPTDAQTAFLRLSLFAGGWSLDAAETTCGTGVDIVDVLATLVDDSLVSRSRNAGDPRFSMLVTIRQFAAKELSTSPVQAEAAQKRFINWCDDLVAAAQPHLMGEEQATWLGRLELEHDNIRNCLDHLERSALPGEVERALQLCDRMWRFWQLRSHLREGRDRIQRLLRLAHGDRTVARARALGACGSIHYWLHEYSAMEASYREQLDIATELGDQDLVADALYNLAFVPLAAGDPGGCLPLFQIALDAVPAHNARLRSQIWLSTAFSQFFTGDAGGAMEPAQRGLRFARSVGDRMSVCEALLVTALISAANGNLVAASDAIGEATAIALSTTSPTLFAMVAIANAVLACSRSDHQRAAALLGASDVLRDDHDVHFPAMVLPFLADAKSQARTALGDQPYEQAYELGARTPVPQLLTASDDPFRRGID
jgi:predicted ATPase/class 3 adenylate cyclase